MGQCVGGPSRPPSALQLCQAYEQQSFDDLAQERPVGSTPPGGEERQDADTSIWNHLHRTEVRAVGEIVSAWAQRQIDGTVARQQIQVRVLRGHSAASVGFQHSLHATFGSAVEDGGAAGSGRDSGSQGGVRWVRPASEPPRETAARGSGRGSSSRGGPHMPNDPLGGGFASGLLSELAVALAGGVQHRADMNQPSHEVFTFIDSIFLCQAFEEARVMAMQELSLEGPRPLPSEVRTSFHRKAKAVLTGPRQPGFFGGPWLDLVRLCLCAELIRHLKISRSGSGLEPHPHAFAPRRPDAGAPAAFHLPQPHPLLTVGARGRMDGPMIRPSMDIIFVTGFPHGAGAGIPGITFARANISGEGPIRMDPEFLRDRVGFLLEALLIGESHLARNNGLTQEEIDRGCPLRPRSRADGGCCPVCLEQEVQGEEIRKLPCGHEIHRECVEAWLATADTCPTCRHQIPRS